EPGELVCIGIAHYAWVPETKGTVQNSALHDTVICCLVPGAARTALPHGQTADEHSYNHCACDYAYDSGYAFHDRLHTCYRSSFPCNSTILRSSSAYSFANSSETG